ncbi:AAA family ATPase [Acinetobacter vivianii]|uniref:AAA family ATPase n=1 Tax=Acinetobacter vivianii TaxID=1776742 RepID=UPI002DBFD709|nr:AAA family ATPase [Acinetobacter vivianii]MEB6666839.1 AAA family ATPase [Acinetobacter vivianii]
MLRNIEIVNFGSYQNFGGLAEKNYFKKMNIIYGANYSGKTTLSRIFALLKSKNDPENYLNPSFRLIFESGDVDFNTYKENSKELLVFNKDFISENLSFLILNNHEKGDIKSFDAVIIGQDQIAIDNKINELYLSFEIFNKIEINAKNILLMIDSERKKISTEKSGLIRLRDNSLTEKARELEASGLNTARTYRRPNLLSDIEVILEKNPQLIRKLTEEEIVKKINDMRVSQKPEINIINKESDIRNSINQHIIDSSLKLQEVFEKSLTKEINEFFKDWSLKGFQLHKDHNKDHCEFCGGELKESVLEYYEKFINQKEEVLIKDINHLINNQSRISKALSALVNEFVDPDAYFYDSFKADYVVLYDFFKSKVFDFSQKLSLLEEKLNEKLIKLSDELIFDFVPLEESFNTLIESYIKLVEICNENDRFSKNIANEQTKLKVEVLEEKIVQYLIEIEWNNKNSKINELETAINDFNPFEKENSNRIDETINFKLNIENEIKKLNAQKSSQIAASQLVNRFLNSFFGHESLSLIPLEGNEQEGRFKIVRNGLEAYNLSEGECTLVAFCYFIALVYNLKQMDKLKDNIVYIDDPISSLDSNNIFYIYSLIENIICKDKNYKQIFISTHNLEFFKYLRKLTFPIIQEDVKSCNSPLCTSTKKNKNDDVGFYFVRKENNVSELTKLPGYLRKYNTEFNYLFSQIWNCANASSALNPDQIYNFSNNMRRFFEVYNYFKYPSDVNKSSFREKFFDAENNLNFFKLVDRIANEYSHAEEIFDRTMKPISSQEMIDTAKFILQRLKANDEIQYNALIQSTTDIRIDI